MQGGRDPFSGFGNPFAGFGGAGDPRSMVSSFFGGRDPFDDPFFTQPFGGGMFEPNFSGPGGDPFGMARPIGFPFGMARPIGFPFGMSRPTGHPFGNAHGPGFLEHQLPHPPTGHPFGNAHGPGFLEHQPPQPPTSRRGPIIEELSSDDENEEKEHGSENKENPRKHGRSNLEPFVEHPDDEADERKSKLMHSQSDFNQSRDMASQPQGHGYAFQSTTVSYGGANGTYYSSSKMRRTGSDGLTFEESKEANSATGQASHKVLKGIHNKGHSVSRKLCSDGKVDTMQTLHNLNEDELMCFDEAWKGHAKKHLPGLHEGQHVIGSGSGGDGQAGPSRTGVWALPSTERSHHPATMAGPSHPRNTGRSRPDLSDGAGSGSSHVRSRADCPSNANQRRRH